MLKDRKHQFNMQGWKNQYYDPRRWPAVHLYNTLGGVNALCIINVLKMKIMMITVMCRDIPSERNSL